MDYIDVAEQLVLLEFQLYARVSRQECLAYAKTQTGNEVAKLNAFCSTHDKVGAWVKSSILSNEMLVKRADTIDFWIKVAEVRIACSLGWMFWRLIFHKCRNLGS